MTAIEKRPRFPFRAGGEYKAEGTTRPRQTMATVGEPIKDPGPVLEGKLESANSPRLPKPVG